jgi:hypothetical protein
MPKLFSGLVSSHRARLKTGSGRWMGHLVWLSVSLWMVRDVHALRKNRWGKPLETEILP